MSEPYNDNDKYEEAPSPSISERSGISMVWLIPIITAIIGGWLVFKTLSEKGPEITIVFKTAQGIEVGKTKIKYKDIEIGVVKAVRFSADFSSIILEAELEKDAEPFLRRETHFWVVKPSLSMRGGASNLGTLLSGSYIEIEPGPGASQRHFIGLEEPPVIKAEEAGTKVVLMTKKLGSIDIGSLVHYKGFVAGEVLGHELANDHKTVFIHAFIKRPYDQFLQSNSRFWNVSGIDISLDASGFSVHTESVESILFGGIAFETPSTLDKVKKDVEGLVFTLYESYAQIEEEAFTKKVAFILFFDGSIRGLSIGAPVEFKGIKVGLVKNIRLEFDISDTSFRIPVLIEIEPERIIQRGDVERVSAYETMKTLIERGLRARLQTGSLLTGQLFVELDMHPGTPVRLVGDSGTFVELPTIPSEMAAITASIKNALAKFEAVKFDEIGEELLTTLKGTNRVFNAPELHDAVADMKGTMKSFRSILGKVDRRIEPMSDNINKAVEAGHRVMDKIEVTLETGRRVMDKTDATLDSVGDAQLAEELAEMARSIRTLVDLLERNPDILIFGKKPAGDK